MARRGERKVKAPVGDVKDPESLWHQFQGYLEALGMANYSPKSITLRDVYLRHFIRWCAERELWKPWQIGRSVLERYRRHLFYYRKRNGEALTAQSQHARILALRHWFGWLTKKGKVPSNPASGLELPRLEKRLPKAILAAKEAEAVLGVPDVGTAVGLRDRAILETLYSTGMRRMEVIGLEVGSVDVERGVVMIRQGKGRKDRVVPIGGRAMAWIAAYRERARPKLLGGREEEALFLTEQGYPLSPSWLSVRIGAYVEKAGIGKQGSCHLFRHTMATLMLEGGADLRCIQTMLGHAHLGTTEIYTRVSIGRLKEVHTAVHPGRMPEAGRHPAED